KPNMVVAKDGTGQFKTIKEALKQCPKGNEGRYVIYVKAGVYDEQMITVPKECRYLLMYGDGPLKTVITGNKSKAKDNIEILENASF
ncbi:putative pectinesterase/pectinesterase inhibitor 21-like, partial [Trifolium medium]|nr:putative pectinesterase/pectinesterase inhibitor 21-like [Trifolium medium]